MYCANCGKEIADNAVICVNCGCSTANFAKSAVGNNKSMAVAVLLWFFFGGFGAHRFYLGHTGSGTAMLLCLLFSWLVIPGIVLFLWWVVDIISLVSGSLQPTDGSKLV